MATLLGKRVMLCLSVSIKIDRFEILVAVTEFGPGLPHPRACLF